MVLAVSDCSSLYVLIRTLSLSYCTINTIIDKKRKYTQSTLPQVSKLIRTRYFWVVHQCGLSLCNIVSPNNNKKGQIECRMCEKKHVDKCFGDRLNRKKRSCFACAHTEKAQLSFFSARSQKRLTTHV